MAVPTGTASMLDIQNEFGGSNPIGLSEYYGVADGIPASGTISINDFRGKAAPIPYSLADATFTTAYSATPAAGWPYSGFDYTTPAQINFSDDGTKVYLAGPAQIYQGTLSTPYMINTASYDYYGPYHYLAVPSMNGKGFALKSDGTKLYAIINGNNDQPVLYQYNIGTAWDITDYSLGGISKNLRSGTGMQQCYSVSFKPDGTKAYVFGGVQAYPFNPRIWEYNLSTAWDITTMSVVTSYSVSSQIIWMAQHYMSEDGTKLFVCDDDAKVSQYNLSTPWSVSTASYSGTSFQGTQSSTFGMCFANNGTYMYTVDPYGDTIYQYTTLG